MENDIEHNRPNNLGFHQHSKIDSSIEAQNLGFHQNRKMEQHRAPHLGFHQNRKIENKKDHNILGFIKIEK